MDFMQGAIFEKNQIYEKTKKNLKKASLLILVGLESNSLFTI